MDGSGSGDISSVMGFSGFGKVQKQAKKFDLDAIFEKTKREAKTILSHNAPASDENSKDDDDMMIGPPVSLAQPDESATTDQQTSNDTNTKKVDSDEDSDDEDPEDPTSRVPITHEATLQHGSKPVSGITLDPAGARLVTGGYDFELKLWDFVSMDRRLKPFRSTAPCGNHQIKSVQFSPTGDAILVCPGSAQAKVLDRDGRAQSECIKGDQYIVNMTNTRGHVSNLNCACWDPKQRGHFMTCSQDCTLRLWNVDEDSVTNQLHVIKCRNKQGKRCVPTTCAYSPDGKLIATALQDGSIQLWNNRSPFVQPCMKQMTAHSVGTDTSCLCFALDNHYLASRGGDDSLKLWDLRQFKRPVGVALGLDNIFPMTECCFSPNQQMIVTGTSVQRGKADSELIFFDKQLEKIKSIPVEDSSIVRCTWHPKLNQLFVGCASGTVHAYYNPDISNRGVMSCVVKEEKRKSSTSLQLSANAPIITPHSLPMFRESQSRNLKRKREKERLDPVLSHKPEPPISKSGGGRIAAGSSLGAYVRKITAMEKLDKEDPRDAVLKYAKVAEEDPYWIAPAYDRTQPEPVFADVQDEEEEKDE
ncbi:WD repeat-containing protein 70-like [Dysidea avara]|uniref:WD repeat-containing protein 70-like n=1 Tax=Dysidea avara TaxID=196820 RepID=UPI003329A623